MANLTLEELLKIWQAHVEASAPSPPSLSQLLLSQQAGKESFWDRLTNLIAALIGMPALEGGGARKRQAKESQSIIPSLIVNSEQVPAEVTVREFRTEGQYFFFSGESNVRLASEPPVMIRFISFPNGVDLFAARPKFWSDTHFVVEEDLSRENLTFDLENWRKLTPSSEMPFRLLLFGEPLSNDEATDGHAKTGSRLRLVLE
ncbi:MAG TPA: hypothetical protein VMF91_04180 [Bryobacteraceae bacterium]|nr:hypothetical protein [Bryobacteraceae bacterium]